MKRSIGTVLREMREKAGFTPKQVYEKFGIKQSRFSAWECDKSEPPTEILLKLCKFYGVTDVLSEFGYNGYNDDGTLSLDFYECELIENYRELDEPIRKAINELVKATASSKELDTKSDVLETIEPETKEQHKPHHIYLAAASGSEGMDDEQLELLDEDVADLLKMNDE